MASTLIEKDLIVLCSGPGGYIAAIRDSQLGRKVTIVERDALGGICLNWGCIPTKALLKTAHLFSEMQHAESFGIEASAPKPNFDKIIGRSRDVAAKLSAGVTYLMKKNKVVVTSSFLPGKMYWWNVRCPWETFPCVGVWGSRCTDNFCTYVRWSLCSLSRFSLES